MVENSERRKGPSSSNNNSAAANQRDSVRSSEDGKVRLKASKLTQFFTKKDQGQKPLEPAKQRAIPAIKQAQPRVILSSCESGALAEAEGKDDQQQLAAQKELPYLSTEMGTTTDDKNHSSSSPEEQKSRCSSEEEKAAVARDDAVDISMKEHQNDVVQDSVTNPVEQVNKRARTTAKDGSFLVSDGTAAHTLQAQSANSTFQDEQIALYNQQMVEDPASSKLLSEQMQIQAENAARMEIEQASDDSDEDSMPVRRRGRRVVKDAEYRESTEVVEAADESEEAPLDDLEPEDIHDAEAEAEAKKKAKANQKAVSRRHRTEIDEANLEGDEQEETVFIDNLPNDEHGIKSMLAEVRRNIIQLEKQFLMEEDSDAEEDEKLLNDLQFDANLQLQEDPGALQGTNAYINQKQFWCVPILGNVMEYNFKHLGEKQMQHGGRLFDIICMDPPWQLSTANPTRGVAIAYSTMNDVQITDLPLQHVQSDGFLFIWVINNKYQFALNFFKKHGYKLVDEIVWVKQTINGKINKGHGYYLQHAKETCLIGYKGDLGDRVKGHIDCDVIFSMRRGQSQKPEEMYDICESLVPHGYYLEIFGRRNNLHDGWCTIGNEL